MRLVIWLSLGLSFSSIAESRYHRVSAPARTTRQAYQRPYSYPVAVAPQTVLRSERSQPRLVPQASLLFGNLELRPTFSNADGTFSTENTAELGLALSETTRISYYQELLSAQVAGEQDWSAGDGYLRVRLSNLWKDQESGLTFSDQIRVYAPTSPTKREAGMITQVRNYFMFSMPLSETVSFDFIDAIVLHAYEEAGKDGAANPFYENRVIIGPTIGLGKNAKLGVPLHFYVRKYRDYDASATNNDLTALDLWFNPELTVNLGKAMYVGAGYRTDSLIQNQEGVGQVLADGAGNGVVQLIFGLSF